MLNILMIDYQLICCSNIVRIRVLKGNDERIMGSLYII